MKKPDDFIGAEWFEDPEVDGQERYWNGKFWSKHIRLIGDLGPHVVPDGQKSLGLFLFRNPIMSDGVFIAFLIVLAITAIYLAEDFMNSFENIYAILMLIPAIALTIIWIYILFLLILIPRRIIDKKNGLNKHPRNSQIVEVGLESKTNQSKKAFLTVGAVSMIAILLFAFQSANSKTDGDRYFEIEQSISAVVKDWNVAATPISQAIRSISDGMMGAAEGRRIAGEASSQFAVISNRLDEACEAIPEYDVNATGREGAFAKSYDALQVTCDLLPQESTEVLLLVREQVSEEGTQENIDYHANQIAIIIEKRRKAILESIDALMPYLSDAQKANIERIRPLLTD
jgi:hypothetical protein